MHKFDPSHACRLDNPERARWQDPNAVVRTLAVLPGSTCVDVGAGTGFFALPLAAAVGSRGHVYALDISSEMLAHLKARLAGAGNVTALLSEESRFPLPGQVADLVFMANVYHELADRSAVLAEARRVLVPGGRVAVMDWKVPRGEDEPGPPTDHRVSAETAMAEMGAAGFTAEQLAGEEFPYHFLVVGTLPA